MGATVRWVEFDRETTELTLADVERVLSPATVLVAVTGASNLLGTRPPVRAIADAVHAARCAVLPRRGAPDARTHRSTWSPWAPTSTPARRTSSWARTAAWSRPPRSCSSQLHPDKLLPATDEVPERFELGTLPYELLAGVTAAVDFHATLDDAATGSRRERLLAGVAALEEHEDGLRRRLEAGLAELPGVVVRSRAASRTPTLLVTFEGRSADEAYEFLAGLDVNAPAGSFYAIEPSRWIGLGDDGGLRAGLAPYSNEADVDRLLAGLAAFVGLG